MTTGMSALITKYMASKMGKIDVPTIPEFLELLGDSGCGLYACKMTVDMFGLTKDDFIRQVEAIIDVGEFYALAKGGHIIFT